MIHETTLAFEYAAKPSEWKVEHITAPRNSCAGMLHFRRALTGIMPGYAETIAGLYIKRLDEWDQYRYVIRGNEVTLADALGILEGRIPVPKYPARKRRPRKELPLADLPLFSGFAFEIRDGHLV